MSVLFEFILNLKDPYQITFINATLIIGITILLIIYRYVKPKKTIKLSILLLIISTVPTLSLFRPGIFESGDMRTHLPYLMGFFQNLKEGNLIPVWMGETCGKYGCPIFEFEYILPYYFGSLLHLLGFTFLTSTKLLLAVPFVLSAFTMYIWAKEEFGKVPGFIASLLYLFSPYHLIITHFKGSVGEVASFVFIPLVFLYIKRIVTQNKITHFFILSISLAALLMSNSSSTIGTTPFAVGYGVVIWLTQKKRKFISLVNLFAALFYGLTISSFYWLPALFEVKYTWLNFINYGSFIPIQNYFFSPTYFGLLFQGHQGEYHQIIGYAQLTGVIIAIYMLFAHKIHNKFNHLLYYFLFSFFFIIFMFLPISKPIWENTPLLNSFIGQTRLLTPMSIITASIFAITLQKKRNLQFLIIISYLIVASTMLNWANRRMRETPTNPIAQDIEIYTEYYNEDDTKYHKRYLERLPLVHEIIQQRPLLNIDFVSGTGSAYEMYRAQTKHIYNVKVITKEAKIRENTLYFPGWTVKANGNPIKIDHEDKTKDNFGKITFSLSKGQYITVVEFSDTPVRFISKIISLISILAGLTIFIYLKIFHPKKPSKLRID